MDATPLPSEHPSEREQDVIREIEQATRWPPPLDEERSGDETPDQASAAPRVSYW
jgi:hypothetical protein